MHCTTCGGSGRCAPWRNADGRSRDCGAQSLEISRAVKVRRKLEELLWSSRIPLTVFAEWVFGRDPRTLQRWRAGAKIPESAAVWIERLRKVELVGGGILLIELQWEERRARWRWFTQKNRRILYESA
jgi:hypothetical protein